jgi:hypothetical protein
MGAGEQSCIVKLAPANLRKNAAGSRPAKLWM